MFDRRRIPNKCVWLLACYLFECTIREGAPFSLDFALLFMVVTLSDNYCTIPRSLSLSLSQSCYVQAVDFFTNNLDDDITQCLILHRLYGFAVLESKQHGP